METFLNQKTSGFAMNITVLELDFTQKKNDIWIFTATHKSDYSSAGSSTKFKYSLFSTSGQSKTIQYYFFLALRGPSSISTVNIFSLYTL